MISTDLTLRNRIDNLSCFPLMIKNFLNEDDIKLVMDYVTDNEQSFGKLSSNYWDGRVVLLGNVKDTKVQNLLINKRLEIISKVESILQDNDIYQKLYSDMICFSRWPEGYELEPHADSENPGGSSHTNYYRNFGSVIYLNTEYAGGELYFPRIGLEFKPEPGMLAVFPGTLKYLHGVKKITTGVRHTVATFLTFDNEYNDNYTR